MLTAAVLPSAAGQWGIALVAAAAAWIFAALGYRRDKRSAQQHPLTTDELAELKVWATTGRLAGKTPKMERYRRAADWRYDQRRERQFIILGAATGVLGLLLLALS